MGLGGLGGGGGSSLYCLSVSLVKSWTLAAADSLPSSESVIVSRLLSHPSSLLRPSLSAAHPSSPLPPLPLHPFHPHQVGLVAFRLLRVCHIEDISSFCSSFSSSSSRLTTRGPPVSFSSRLLLLFHVTLGARPLPPSPLLCTAAL